jgi:hypothetical protein
MRIERVREIKKDSKIHKLIEEFIKTNYDRVEVINEDDYKDNVAMTAALRWIIKSDYANKVKISKIKDRVYLSKVDFEYK